jgi:signal transduction histidine kinase
MKRKDLNHLKPLAALLWILCPALGAGCGYFSAKAIGTATLIDLATIDMSEDYHYDIINDFRAANFQGAHTQADLIGRYTIFAAALGILAILGVIALLVMTGNFGRDENGKPVLNWFDKLWTEIHLAVLILACGGAIAVFVPIVDMWPAMSGQGFTPNYPDDYFYGMSNSIITCLCVAGCYFCLLAALFCLVTLVKKLKAGTFLRNSIIGIAVIAVWRGIRHCFRTVFRSDKFMRKYVLIGIGMVILAMTWVGAIVDLILIFIMVPKLVKKYSGIREGVNEVKSGNLTYKIPVEADEKGPVTDFDSLASDINEISQATNAAVQNELKNQRLKTDLISNVSHDLKTPLTSMITYVDLLKTEGLDSEHAPEYLEILDEKTRRLKGLTENLFEAAKASSGNIPCEITDIDITAIVNQALAEMEDRLSERDLNVIVKNELSSPMVRADGQLLWRVIENLLSNVSKYAQTGSRVYVNLSDSTGNPSAGKGHALLEVKNISADPLNIPADELMERFKRGDESRNTEGSGLGLAIAKDLTRLMNGVFEITIDGDLFKASVMLEKA